MITARNFVIFYGNIWWILLIRKFLVDNLLKIRIKIQIFLKKIHWKFIFNRKIYQKTGKKILKVCLLFLTELNMYFLWKKNYWKFENRLKIDRHPFFPVFLFFLFGSLDQSSSLPLKYNFYISKVKFTILNQLN